MLLSEAPVEILQEISNNLSLVPNSKACSLRILSLTCKRLFGLFYPTVFNFNVKTLDLRLGYKNSSKTPSIPPRIFQLTHAVELNFSSPTILEWPLLTQFQKLRELHLAFADDDPFFDFFDNHDSPLIHSLHVLSIHKVEFTDRFWSLSAKFLRKIPNLQTLNLELDRKNEACAPLPLDFIDSIFTVTAVSFAYLKTNDECLIYLLSHTHVKSLRLISNINKIGDAAAAAINASPTLTDLYIEFMDCSSVILYPSNPVSTLRNYTFKDVTFDDSNQNSKQPLVEHINSLNVVSPSPSLHGDDLEIENCDPIYFPLLKEFISSITLHRLEVGMTDDDTTYAVANIVKHCTSLRILIAYLMDNTDSWLSLDASAAFRDAVIQSTTLRELHVPRSLSLESTDVFTENQTLKAITFLECGELPESLEFFRWIEMNENRLKNENSSLKSVSFVYPDEEPIRLVDFHVLENRLKAVIYDLKNHYYSDTRLIHRLCERIVDGWRNEVPDSRIIDRLVLDNVRDDHWDLIWKYVLIVMEKKLELEPKSFDKLKAKLQFGMVDGEYCLWFN